MPCEMPGWSNPHLADQSLKVPSRLFRKAAFGVRKAGNREINRRMSPCDNLRCCFTASISAAMSAFWKSRNWPLVTRMSSYPSRSTSRKIGPHDQPDASTLA